MIPKNISPIAFSKKTICDALDGIVKIKAFLHRIKFSSSLNYRHLKKIFPSLFQPPESKKIAQQRMSGMYQNIGWARLSSGRQIEVFYNTLNPGLPDSLLSLSSPTVQDLLELDKLLRQYTENNIIHSYYQKYLQISSIEYTLDFICKSSTDVGNLFFALRRNCYFPYATTTNLSGGNFTGYSHEQDYSLDRDENSLFIVNFGKNINKMAKIYERGKDNDKGTRDTYWKHEKCDRVRYEYTFKRNYLRKYEINSVLDLLNNTKFYEFYMNNSYFQTKRFTEKSYRQYTPPKYYQDYTAGINNYKFDCLTEEIIYAKKRKLDVSKCIENHPQFKEISKMVEEAILKFEKRWEKQYIKNSQLKAETV
ncbi:MAG: hypothetical protein ACYDBT_09735 [Desulfobulbaceae bacterium]